MTEIVFLNGKFISPKEAKLPVFRPGFLYGWGLFETMRSYNSSIVYFDRHLRRIKNSSALIDMKFPYSIDKFKDIIRRTVKLNGLTDAYVRLTLWKSDSGTDALVTVKNYQPYPLKKYKEGFRACIWKFKQNENAFLSQVKTTNYLFYRLAYSEAKKKGFDEALILNNRGYIAEGSHTNIFLVKAKELWTPALACGCLDGITRQVVLDLAKKYHIKTYQGNLTLSDLYKTDEAFLTNSLLGIMPLSSIEKQKVGRGAPRYQLTYFFIQKYQLLLKNAT